MSLSSLLGWKDALVLLAVAFGALFIWRFHLAPSWTSYANLPGPPSVSYLWGNMKGLISEEPGVGHENLVLKYGKTLRFTGFLGGQRFYTADPRAISHILGEGYDYPKPARVVQMLEQILGQGLLTTEGDMHKKQRKVIVPAFSREHIRNLTPLFMEHAYELKDKMQSLIEDDKPTRIDVLHWIGRCTLDVIGRAGFDYNFNALKYDHDELSDSFQQMFAFGSDINMLLILQSYIPWLKIIPTRQSRAAAAALVKMEEIGTKLVEAKKQAVIDSVKDSVGIVDGAVAVGKKDLVGKDVLSSLIRSNMAHDLKPEQRLSDKEVIGQISTFMLAGQETSATALAWALYALCENLEIQDKLRAELIACPTDEPSMDELNALPYLDAVIRETMRLHAPVPSTIRTAGKDDLLPLSEPITNTRDGKPMTAVPIAKGTSVFIPILNLNTLDELWDGDGHVFRPERWQGKEFSEATKGIPGVWTHMSTFLSGPRSCIGYRFALAEVKAIMFVLLRSFVFTHLEERPNFIKKLAFLIVRPRIKGEEDLGAQLPLLVKPYRP